MQLHKYIDLYCVLLCFEHKQKYTHKFISFVDTKKEDHSWQEGHRASEKQQTTRKSKGPLFAPGAIECSSLCPG
jgi:hypothetical protein